MCHHRERSWTEATADDEATDGDEEELPSFLNDEVTETEVLTDGGDEA
ncbi:MULTISPECIES: hypothetical protein [unclassified Haloarcula]|nr:MULTISPECIES: hypothetical protein [unclassified Haloarcula]